MEKLSSKQTITYLSMKVYFQIIHFKQYSWFIKGETNECQVEKFKNSIKMIAAIISNGTFFVRLSSQNSNSEVFSEFLSDLAKYLKSKTYFKNKRLTIMLDNASYHKTNEVRDKLKTIATNVCFIPPYTPQFQPIELFFGAIKCMLREERPIHEIKWSHGEEERLLKSKLLSVSWSTVIKCFRKVFQKITGTILECSHP